MSIKLVCVVNDVTTKDSNLHHEHGVSFWIETEQGILLFDTAQTASVLSHNLQVMGLSPAQIDAAALSHGHNDHTGGLDVLINAQKMLPLYANQDLFTPRFSVRNKEYREIGIPFDKAVLKKSFFLHLKDAPQEIFKNLWTTGIIKKRPEKIGGSPHHFIAKDGNRLPDPYTDDMSLVLKTGKGLVLICGCCHAGLLNTLAHVEATFGTKVISMIGGAHLGAYQKPELDQVIEVIQQKYPECTFLLNHCTGANAIQRMQEKLDNHVEEFLPGSWLAFN